MEVFLIIFVLVVVGGLFAALAPWEVWLEDWKAKYAAWRD